MPSSAHLICQRRYGQPCRIARANNQVGRFFGVSARIKQYICRRLGPSLSSKLKKKRLEPVPLRWLRPFENCAALACANSEHFTFQLANSYRELLEYVALPQILEFPTVLIWVCSPESSRRRTYERLGIIRWDV